MPVCEQCWHDSRGLCSRYDELLREREFTPCTPEQQAGLCATDCPRCGRTTIHQYEKVCMNPACPDHDGRGHNA